MSIRLATKSWGAAGGFLAEEDLPPTNQTVIIPFLTSMQEIATVGSSDSFCLPGLAKPEGKEHILSHSLSSALAVATRASIAREAIRDAGF